MIAGYPINGLTLFVLTVGLLLLLSIPIRRR